MSRGSGIQGAAEAHECNALPGDAQGLAAADAVAACLFQHIGSGVAHARIKSLRNDGPLLADDLAASSRQPAGPWYAKLRPAWRQQARSARWHALRQQSTQRAAADTQCWRAPAQSCARVAPVRAGSLPVPAPGQALSAGTPCPAGWLPEPASAPACSRRYQCMEGRFDAAAVPRSSHRRPIRSSSRCGGLAAA